MSFVELVIAFQALAMNNQKCVAGFFIHQIETGEDVAAISETLEVLPEGSVELSIPNEFGAKVYRNTQTETIYYDIAASGSLFFPLQYPENTHLLDDELCNYYVPS